MIFIPFKSLSNADSDVIELVEKSRLVQKLCNFWNDHFRPLRVYSFLQRLPSVHWYRLLPNILLAYRFQIWYTASSQAYIQTIFFFLDFRISYFPTLLGFQKILALFWFFVLVAQWYQNSTTFLFLNGKGLKISITLRCKYLFDYFLWLNCS